MNTHRTNKSILKALNNNEDGIEYVTDDGDFYGYRAGREEVCLTREQALLKLEKQRGEAK